MSDNSSKGDRSNRAEPWEVEFVHYEMPTHSYNILEQMLVECKKELNGTTDRKKLLNCVRKKAG